MTVIFDRSNGQELRINTIGSWLRRQSGKKVVKLSVDAGFTCPNRDGNKGCGGCLFCSDAGSGDHASRIGGPVGPATEQDSDHGSSAREQDSSSAVREALESQIRLLLPKWPDGAYIAYFQSNTNTYGPVDRLRELYETALDQPGIVGIAIATRPDCLSKEVLDLLAELDSRTFLWVELGLQTIHGKTMEDMNLCYSLADYEKAVLELSSRGIRIVTHLMLGLPGEDREMMLDSVRHVCRPIGPKENAITSGDNLSDTAGPSEPTTGDFTTTPTTDVSASTPTKNISASTPNTGVSASTGKYIFGLKLHMLNVVSDSALPERYPGYVPFESIDEYTDLVVDALELIPSDITIHRVYADAPKETLIAPTWARQKRLVLNEIHKKLRDRDTWQGRRAETL